MAHRAVGCGLQGLRSRLVGVQFKGSDERKEGGGGFGFTERLLRRRGGRASRGYLT